MTAPDLLGALLTLAGLVGVYFACLTVCPPRSRRRGR